MAPREQANQIGYFLWLPISYTLELERETVVEFNDEHGKPFRMGLYLCSVIYIMEF